MPGWDFWFHEINNFVNEYFHGLVQSLNHMVTVYQKLIYMKYVVDNAKRTTQSQEADVVIIVWQEMAIKYISPRTILCRYNLEWIC